MRLAVFLAGTLVIAVLSWFVSIRQGRYHGVYRFFAFEGILGLLLLNFRAWFRNPFSPLQIFSWLFLLVSLPLVFGGVLRILREGRPSGQFENTTRLATGGLYRVIRHPMYASYSAFALGVFLKDVTPWTTAIILGIAGATWLTARQEEKEMLARFGPAYAAYMARTKRFVPGLF